MNLCILVFGKYDLLKIFTFHCLKIRICFEYLDEVNSFVERETVSISKRNLVESDEK